MKITICDVCEVQRIPLPSDGVSLRSAGHSLRAAGEVHPHNNEPLAERRIDVCGHCLGEVLESIQFPCVEQLRHLRNQAKG